MWSGNYALDDIVAHKLAEVARIVSHQPTRFLEACVSVYKVILKEGNVKYLKAKAHEGIKTGTTADPKDDREDFKDPVHNSVHLQSRGLIQQYLVEKTVQFKSRGEGETAPAGTKSRTTCPV